MFEALSPRTTRLGFAAVSLFSAVTLAACGSDSPTGGQTLSGNGSSAASTSASTSASASSSAESTEASSEASSSEATGGASGGDKTAFCKTYDLKKVTAAQSDPKAARDNLKQVAAVAPPEIKSDAELIYETLDDALNGKQPSTTDASKIRTASANVAKYYVQNCR